MNIYDKKEFFDEYTKMSRSQEGLHGAGEWHQFKNFFPDLKGKKVLDLGCGYGWHCMHCVHLGASEVIGIDGSELMIQKAQRTNVHEKITYAVLDLLAYDYPKDHFDCVVSNLVLHYIEDLNGVYKKVHQTLKQDGIFIFNIEHPTFTAGIHEDFIYDNEGNILHYPITDYYYAGKRDTLFLGHHVEKYHHTLTQILNGLLECGFVIEKIEEAMPESSAPWYKIEMLRPMMLLVRARKG